jgi:DMSO/TMAO reductase YedYZ heme-binding membrane subunit
MNNGLTDFKKVTILSLFSLLILVIFAFATTSGSLQNTIMNYFMYLFYFLSIFIGILILLMCAINLED